MNFINVENKEDKNFQSSVRNRNTLYLFLQPSALGMLVVMVLKMLTSTRNIVIRRVILRRNILFCILVEMMISPARNHVWRNQKTDPGHHHEHTRGQIASDNVVRHLPPQPHLKPSHGIVSSQCYIILLMLRQSVYLNGVVEH